MARLSLRTTRTLLGRIGALLCMILLAMLLAPSIALADQSAQSSGNPQAEQNSQMLEKTEQADAPQVAKDAALTQETQKAKADPAPQGAQQKAGSQPTITSDDQHASKTESSQASNAGEKAASIKPASETQPIAFAVFDETTKTLSFHKQPSVPTEGATFVGSDGVTRTVTKLYEDIETLKYSSSTNIPVSAAWNSVNGPAVNSTSVVFVDEISPGATSGWFANLSLITSLDLTKLNTENSISMMRMFDGCTSLTSLDLTPLKTGNVTDMRLMFKDCSSLTELDFSNFDTRNVTAMNTMFSGCSSMKGFDLRSFDTSKVVSMPAMFTDCASAVIIDLSSFDITGLTQSMVNYFNGCVSLTTVYAGEKWIPNDKVLASMNPVFKDCLNLVGSKGSRVDMSSDDIYKIASKYLRIDGGPGNKGYLSTHKKNLAAATVTGLEMHSVLCTDMVGPTPTVMDGDKLLVLGVDYQTEFTPRGDKKNAKIIITGMGEYEGFIRKEFATMYILSKQASDNKIVWSRDRLDEAIEQTEKNAPIVLKSDSRFADFIRLLLNGKEVGPEHYTATEGSTVIEIDPDYLNSLKNGTYVVEIESLDKTVAAEITIEGNNEPVDPDPGVDPDDPKPVDPDPVNPDPVNPDPVDPVNPNPVNPVNPDPADSSSNSGANAGASNGTGQGTQAPANPVSGGAAVADGGSAAIIAPGADDQPSKAYSFLSGANATHEIGSGKELTVRADGDLEKFVAVLVDDEELDGAHYTTRAGSTIVAIAPEYLDTLSSGQHKLTVRFKDGETTTHFTVRQGSEDVGASAGPAEDEPLSDGVKAVKTQAKNAEDSQGDSPDTGEGSMMAWVLLMFACFFAFCGLRMSRKDF